MHSSFNHKSKWINYLKVSRKLCGMKDLHFRAETSVSKTKHKKKSSTFLAKRRYSKMGIATTMPVKLMHSFSFASQCAWKYSHFWAVVLMNAFGVPIPRTKSWSSPANAYTDVPMECRTHTQNIYRSLQFSLSLSLYIYIYIYIPLPRLFSLC